jgi:hypothetical protein
MPPVGAEQVANSNSKSKVSSSRGTQSGTPPADPDLQAVIDAWPALPVRVRKIISDLIRDAE